MAVYHMNYNDLAMWTKTQAQLGDIAFCYDSVTEFCYTYKFDRQEQNPRWFVWLKMKDFEEYLSNLETKNMEKRCENCKYFNVTKGIGYTLCSHKEHEGTIVANFTSCPEHEFKEVLESCPFCGGEAELITYQLLKNPYEYMVRCSSCGISQKCFCSDKESAVNAWNRRDNHA